MEEDGSVEGELLYIIQRFLSVGPCKQAAEVLKDEIERHRLLPGRIDFEGNSHVRSFKEYDRCLNNLLPKNYLKRICSRLPPLLNTTLPHGNLEVKLSLIGTGKYSLLREENVVDTKLGNDFLYALQGYRKCVPLPQNKICSVGSLLSSRQFTGINSELLRRLCSDTFLVNHVNLHKRIFGHLSSVFCVAFDRSGQYILTGADDHLIKLWLVENGRLLFTFRGLSGEVTDLTVSHENTLLAAGSCDKTIRVWCLRTGSPVAVLQGHSAMVTTLQFLPYVNGEDRWLLSTGNDCCVCFWKWNVKTNKFILEPVKYPERLRVSGQMVCSSHSPGGRFIVAGGTDYYVRVYVIRDGQFPERIIETEGHTDRVSTVQWAHKGLKFVTGSRDGIAKIWMFSRQEWHTKPLIMDKRYENGKGLVPITPNDPKNLKLKVTMLTWSADDYLIVSAVSDMTLRVWDASSGVFLRMLLNHTDEIFVLEPHPLNPKIVLSAAHDGRLLLWDITTGEMKKRHFNEIENHGHGAFFDARFGPDGEKIAAVDSHGHLSIFGAGDNQNIRSAVTEQFFHTDYRPLIRDANQYVLDEQTQLAPHLMSPPFLVNSDGDPHPPAIQRRVPGRENFSDDFLVPVVVRNSEDDANEILDIGDNGGINASPGLSHELMDQHENQSASISQTTLTNGTANSSQRNGPTQRRWSVWLSRCLVRPLKSSILEAGNKLRLTFGAEELNQYDFELKRPPLPLAVETPQDANLRLRQRRKVPKVNTRSNHIENSVAGRAQNDVAVRDTAQNDQGDQNPPSSIVAQVEEESELDSEYSDDDNSLSSDSASTSSFSCSDAIVFSGSDEESSRRELRSSQQNDWTNHAKNDRTSKRRLRTTKKLRQELLEKVEDRNKNEDDESSQQPTTSAAAATESGRPKRTKKVRQEIYIPANLDEKKNVRRGQRVSLPIEPSCLTDVPEKYWFPDWITCTVPRKTPYFPQIKDQVVYFPLGHSLYIDVVERLNIYPIDFKTVPWKKHKFQDQEFAIVLNVRFEITPIRLCCLKLAQINPVTGLKTGLNYTIRYHDIPNVIDFIVLRHHYDQSLKRKWKEGDRFQAVIDDNWWFGTIIKKEAYDQRFPNSIFLSFKVLWDNGDEERLSPWDLELFNAKKCPVKKGTCILLSEEELCQLAAYEPKPGDWINDRERDIGRLCRALEQIAQFSFAEPFAAPVDLNTYPTYCLCVEYPSDLSTIKTRLDNYFYRRIQAVQFDIKQIHKNAVTFNETRSQIVSQAKLICEVLLRFIGEPSCDDISQIYNEVTNEKPSQKERSRGARKSKKSRRRKYMSSKDDETEDEKPQIKGWLDDCQKVLDVVKAREAQNMASNADPERSDSENSYNADDIAATMNLKIIQENLINDRYASPHCFHEDLITYFNNKKIDKTSKRSKTYLNVLRLKGTVSQLMQPVFDNFQVSMSYPKFSQAYNTRNKKIAFTQLVEGNYDSELSNNNNSHQSISAVYHESAHRRNQPIEKRRRIVSDQSEEELGEKSIRCHDGNDRQKASTSGVSSRKISAINYTNSNNANSKRKRDDGEKIDKMKINIKNFRQNCLRSSGEEEEGENSQNSTKFTSIKRKSREKRKIEVESVGDDHISTRYKGKQTIKYAESSDEEDFDFERNDNEEDGPSIVISTSSRGRICKLRKFT